jgi:hypothetical protein
MTCSGMLRRVALVRTDVSEELSSSFIRVTRISELETTLAVTMPRPLVRSRVVPSSPILVALIKGLLSSSETSVLTRATWLNIPEDAILHSYSRETSNLTTLSFIYTSIFMNVISKCKSLFFGLIANLENQSLDLSHSIDYIQISFS